MELKLNIGFNELLRLIKQLPPNQIIKLKEELNNDILQPLLKSETNSFQKLLLSGPVMEINSLNNFKKVRNSINKWRKK